MNERSGSLPYWLSAPGTIVVLVFVAIPLVLTFGLSLHPLLPDGSTSNSLSLANYVQIVTDEYILNIFGRTAILAFLVTLICIVIGVPEAYALSRLSSRWRAVSIVIVLGPLLVSVVVRTLGWAILLGNEGVINKLLVGAGIVEFPVKLMYTFTGLTIALVHVLVPFMVLAVWASLQKLDPAVEQAADSLGAKPFTILRRIVLPQVIPGVLSGGLIVFALSASAFATPSIIGGRRLKIVSTIIYDKFLNEVDWPMGAAVSAVLLAAVLVISLVVNRFVERRYKQVFV